MNESDISKRLKTLRSQRRLTVKEVARQIGVAQSTYREWEYGRAIKGQPYQKLAQVFDVSLTELLTGQMPNVEQELIKIVEIISKIRQSL